MRDKLEFQNLPRLKSTNLKFNACCALAQSRKLPNKQPAIIYCFVLQINYENTIEELQREINQLAQIKQEVESEYSTLKRTVENKEEEGKRRQSMLEVS